MMAFKVMLEGMLQEIRIRNAFTSNSKRDQTDCMKTLKEVVCAIVALRADQYRSFDSDPFLYDTVPVLSI